MTGTEGHPGGGTTGGGTTGAGRASVDRDHNFVTDMDLRQLLVDPERCLVVAPVTAAVRASAGAVSLGVIANMFDLGASDPAMVSCRPGWIATQDLSLRIASPLVDGPVIVDARLVRVGKKAIVVRTDVYDGRGNDDIRALATAVDDPRQVHFAGAGILTFARLPGSAVTGEDDYRPADWIGQVRLRPAQGPVVGSLYQRMGVTVVDQANGVLELARTPYLTNSIGTILGGAQAVLVEAAAEGVRPGMAAADLQMHFLAQVKVGPVRSRARVLRHGADHVVVEVSLADAGHDGLLLALATVTLVPSPAVG